MSEENNPLDKPSENTSPESSQKGRLFEDFCKTVQMLRDPILGCPWDLKQDHKSLRRYMIEEAYEAADAMGKQDRDSLVEELGDVLLQVILNAQIGRDQGRFTIEDVIHSIDAKMKRRHPHVFKENQSKTSSYSEQIAQNTNQILGQAYKFRTALTIDSPDSLGIQWEEIKSREKRERAKNSKKHSKSGESDHKTEKDLSALGEPTLQEDLAILPKTFPSLLRSQKVGKISSKWNFDWNHPDEVFAQLESEFSEAKEAFQKWTSVKDSTNNFHHLLTEIGDLFFTLTQFCRHLGVDSETVAIEGCSKFERRFLATEILAVAEGINLKTASEFEKQKLWDKVKQTESKEMLK